MSTHDDETPFDDNSRYLNAEIVVRCAELAPVGATSMQLEIVNAAPDLTGVRFSYQHALYETGKVTNINGAVWTVGLSTSIRKAIPAGALLEFDAPDCLCHLAEDAGMDVSIDYNERGTTTVSFVEAVDYWSDLAAGLVT